MTRYETIQVVHSGAIHIVPEFSNSALCGALIQGKIRPTRRPPTCSKCEPKPFDANQVAQWILDDAADEDEAVQEFAASVAARIRSMGADDDAS